MDRLDWTLWTEHAGHGLDGLMDQRLDDVECRQKVLSMTEIGHLVSVKGNECMNTIKAMRERHGERMQPVKNCLTKLGSETEQEILEWSKTQSASCAR